MSLLGFTLAQVTSSVLFPAAILNDALNTGKYDRGVIVAESFDYEIIDKAYRPYHNLSLPGEPPVVMAPSRRRSSLLSRRV